MSTDPSPKTALWELYISFFRIGAMMFGGGYAMLPLLTREIIDRREWASEQEMLDYFAVAQCTPGVIAVNVSTFIGRKMRGFAGAVAATAGIITVPFILIILIVSVLLRFWFHPVVVRAFSGIRTAVAALILSA